MSREDDGTQKEDNAERKESTRRKNETLVSTCSSVEWIRAERGWKTSASEKDLRLWLDKVWTNELCAVAISGVIRL